MEDSSEPRDLFWTAEDLRPTVAELTLINFTSSYTNALFEIEQAKAVPRDIDEIALSCLLICSEFGDFLSPSAAMAMNNCRTVVHMRGEFEWLDALIWDVAIELLGTKTDDPLRGMEGLVANLTHNASDIRGFLFDVAWIVRKRLPKEESAFRLLRNTADTLCHWSRALGLCSQLFDDEQSFWAFCETYQPETRFEKQFRERVESAQEYGLVVLTSYFHQLETRIRSRISSYAMRLPGD